MVNQYFLMRHGESESNVLRLIACDPVNSATKHGLTLNGRQQVFKSAGIFASEHESKPIIISSYFLRASQTAQILAEVYKVNCKNDERLRERNFGQLAGQSVDNYAKVWDVSDQDPDSTPFDAESSQSVLDRVKSVIDECESRYKSRNIVLVSHGDPLVIACSYFQQGSLTNIIHHFANAEIRRLI